MSQQRELLAPHARPIRLLFFWIGIAATLLYRAIIILNNVSAAWVQAAWYVGTIGFILYFAHRYQISEKRSRIIAQYRLTERVQSSNELSSDEKAALAYLLGTLRSSKEKWNFIVIFVSSGLALAIGLYLDFLR